MARPIISKNKLDYDVLFMIWSALILGLLGNLHCVGMCGPIALALPLHHLPFKRRVLGLAIYNAGRVITYAILGGLFGFIGKGFSMAGLHQGISLFLGIGILVVTLTPLMISSKLKAKWSNSGLMQALRMRITSLLKRKNMAGYAFLGVLNGLLPCGLVYVGIAGAILTGSTTGGIIYMTLFGLGTIPLMLLMPLMSNLILNKYKVNTRQLIPILSVIVALLFVIRGLGLDIPYISPHTETMQVSEPIQGPQPMPHSPKKSCH